MPSINELVTWAKDQASKIEAMTLWNGPSEFGQGYWGASHKNLEEELRAAASAAVAFLSEYGGRDSPWASRADAAATRTTETTAACAREVAGVLRQWATQVEEGWLMCRASS